MAYLPSYEYDIFVSYSHLDNQAFFNQQDGWITCFCLELGKLISQRIGKPDTVKIWWDQKRLDGSTLFDQSISSGLARSAIFVALTSSAYLKSDYCRKELALFNSAAQNSPQGLAAGERSRFVNVLLNNISYKQWPSELNGTTGFPFFESDSSEDPGDPVDVTAPAFRSQLKLLRNALVSLMDAFHSANPGPNLKLQAAAGTEGGSFSIYFGDVPDSLRTVRKRVMAELDKKGYRIICDVPPPYERLAHDEKVRTAMDESNMLVHLLDQYSGKEMEGADTLFYPQQQASLALERETPKLIWVPAETDTDAIEEDTYRSFIKDIDSGKLTSKNTEYIRGSKSMLTQEIADFAEKLIAQQVQKPLTGKTSVLLDTHLEDQKYAWELSLTLLENEIQPYINPQEDDPRDNSILLGDRIAQVNKLVFLYGKVNWQWVQKRINAALKLIINNQYPVDEFFILMLPPLKDPKSISFEQRFLKVNVIDNSDSSELDVTALQHFFSHLKTVA